VGIFPAEQDVGDGRAVLSTGRRRGPRAADLLTRHGVDLCINTSGDSSRRAGG